MRISYIGSGYVGQVNAAAAAKFGHNVILVDTIKEKVDSINKGIPTIYEQGLDELLKEMVVEKKRLRATTSINEAVQNSDISIICVGTPDRGGMIDLSYIQQVAHDLGVAIKDKDDFHIVVVKSTVVPGTTFEKVKPIIERQSGKTAGIDFGIAMNPEFLREGVALDDAINPDSVVIGTMRGDRRTKDAIRNIYSWVPDEKIIYVGISEAEAIKYAKNSFLAMKITFANEWANFCDRVGIDAKQVLEAIGMDKRISPYFLRNGPGYGGSCFPKDVNAIIHEGVVRHSPFRILEEVVRVNNYQYLKLVDLAERVLGERVLNKKVAVLGLSFKPFTDDVRESPALKLVSYLVSQNCRVSVYCPQGMKQAREWFERNRIHDLTYAASAEECIKNSEMVFIATDWPEFKEILKSKPAELPVFIGHRSLVEPDEYTNVYALGFPITGEKEKEV